MENSKVNYRGGRNSNLELCRLVAMLLIMCQHSMPKHTISDASSTLLLMWWGFNRVGVNVFVLISGYFSIKPKKTSLTNLLFICLFWCIVKIVYMAVSGQHIGIVNLLFVTTSNWFIPCYIGLMLLAPFLNEYCLKASKKELWTGVLLLLFAQTWFDWCYPNSSMGAHWGYSLMSFMILYLLARTIRLHGIPKWFRNWSFSIFFICSLIIGLMAIASEHYLHKVPEHVAAYNNPFVIIASVAFLLTFEKLVIRQSRFINHIAGSTLALLLGHAAIITAYKSQFQYLYDNYSGFYLICFWTLSIIIVAFISILIDQVRILIYSPIERMIKIKIKNNNLY